MFVKVCPLCKSKFYSATKDNSSGARHLECEHEKSNKMRIQAKAFRTSTPVPETESITSSFSDSVIDFFYQTWKSGLGSDSCTRSAREENDWQTSANRQQQPHSSAPFFYACSPVYYVNTVICQSVVPAVYLQPVGYRPDGTFGVLPYYWPCVTQ